MKLSVLIPVYNECKTISLILEKVKSVSLDKEIIVVDDGSVDGSKEFLKTIDDPQIRVIFHERNMGKGSALRSAIAESSGDIVIFQDADLEYDPSEYPALIKPIVDGVADVVYGSRLAGGRPQRVYMFWHKLGNNFLTFLMNILFNTTLTDIETGYKVFRGEVIREMHLRSRDFSIEAEITAKVFKRKLRVYELPVSYYGRGYAEGKKITWLDGFAAIYAILKYRLID